MARVSLKDIQAAKAATDKLLSKRAQAVAAGDGTKPEHVNIVGWLKKFAHIRAKGGGLIKFDQWKPAQKRLAAYIVRKIALGQPIKLVIHKSRQLGVSTVVQAIYFALIRFHPETAAIVIADTKDKARLIFDNVERIHHYLPKEEKEARPVEGGQAHAEILEYEYPHRSQFIVATGERGAAGLMLNFVHVSEGAFIPNFDKLLAGLMPAVPEASVTPLTIVVVESTANGKNAFYHLCKRAQKAESDWDFMFLGWKDDPTARLPIAPDEVFELDEEETEFAKEYGLDLEQMKWCRKRRLDDCGGNWEVFHQEYPVVSEVSFLFSGWPWFHRKRVETDMEKALTTVPLFKGHIFFEAADSPYVKLQPDPLGPFWIWEHPISGVSYSIGMDVAYGVGGDYTEIHVIRDDTLMVVAIYRSNRIEPGAASVTAFQIGAYYYWALLGIENNGPGLTVLTNARDGHADYPQTRGGYPNLFYSVRYDRSTQEETKQLGFSTTGKSKDLILQRCRELYNTGKVSILSYALLYQMDGFSRDEERKRYIQNNQDPKSELYNDDGIMALAICVQMVKHGADEAYCDQPGIVDY